VAGGFSGGAVSWGFLSLAAFVLSIVLCGGGGAPGASPDEIKTKGKEKVGVFLGGQPSATFKPLAQHIFVVLSDEKNLRVLAVDGGAAVQNLEDVIYLRNIDMALTTLEAMNYARTSSELGSNIGERLAYIAPLFPNPLQILARGGANSIKD